MTFIEVMLFICLPDNQLFTSKHDCYRHFRYVTRVHTVINELFWTTNGQIGKILSTIHFCVICSVIPFFCPSFNAKGNWTANFKGSSIKLHNVFAWGEDFEFNLVLSHEIYSDHFLELVTSLPIQTLNEMKSCHQMLEAQFRLNVPSFETR